MSDVTNIRIGDKVRIQRSAYLLEILAERGSVEPEVDGQIGRVTHMQMGTYNEGEMILHIRLEDGDVHELALEDVVEI